MPKVLKKTQKKVNKSEEPIWYLTKKVWKHSENKTVVIGYIFIFILSNLVLLLYPLLIAKIINIIQLEGVTQNSITKLIFWVCGYLILELAFWGLHGPARYIESANAFKAKASYKMHLLKGIMSLPASWHANHESGDTIDKIEKGSKALYEFAEYGFMVIASITRIIGATIALFLFNIPAGIITSIIILITIATVIKFDKIIVPKLKKLNILDNQISAKVYDTVSNITTIIILRLENLVTKSLLAKIMHPLPLYKNNVKIKELKWFTVSTISTFMFIGTLGAYIITHLKTNQVILIGSFMALFQYVTNIENIFFHFTYQYGEIVRHKTDVQNAELLAYDFEKHNEIQKAKQDNNKKTALTNLNKISWQVLNIEKLKFFYSKEDQAKNTPTLSVKYLTIKQGEKIALVGESGAGKTTFLKLLRDLYTPQVLTLKLDNDKIEGGFKQIANSISLIPQDPEIFAGTIKENITFGIKTKNQTIKKFTDLARFTDVIPTLPKELNSQINEKGVNLSGGQKQRLALARGLLASKNKEIVLLDEPTSSVDAHNELKIYQNILKEFKNKTIISSMHRLHLLPYFDRIFYFENGKISQTGTLPELLRTNKKFKSLWNKYKTIE